jgi:hypothetical protein
MDGSKFKIRDMKKLSLILFFYLSSVDTIKIYIRKNIQKFFKKKFMAIIQYYME